jgi:hypothetical protein
MENVLEMAEKGKSVQEKKKRGGPQPGSGRKPFVPSDKDRVLAEQLATWAVPEKHIASLMGEDGIDQMTLRKYLSEEIERGRAKASMGIGSTLYQKAMAGDVASLIWWTKTQMRWAEQPKVIEISGQISITQALEEAAQRVIEAEIVEVDEPLQLANEPTPGVKKAPDGALKIKNDADESGDERRD